MLTTFKDPMYKCSSWNYDALCCQIDSLDELSVWQLNIWTGSNVLNLDLSFVINNKNHPLIGECGGAALCCPYASSVVKLHLAWPWGRDASRMHGSSGVDEWKHKESKQMQTNLAHLDC